MSGWIRKDIGNNNYTESLDGIDWADAPLPRRWHRCRAQTRGWIGLSYVERCPCGGTRLEPRGRWMEKNQTRRQRARRERDERAPKETVTCRTCGKPYEDVAGSAIVAERLCTRCWSNALLAAHGYPVYDRD